MCKKKVLIKVFYEALLKEPIFLKANIMCKTDPFMDFALVLSFP